MRALEDANPETIVRRKYHQNSTEIDNIFLFVFWCFRPCIDDFNAYRLVISIGGTF